MPADRPWRSVARLLAAVWLGCCLLLGGMTPARAQGIDLPVLDVARQDGGLVLNFVARPQLSRAVEDAMRRGVPLYFVAQASVYRPRWYWRDERVARASRTWRLSFQPLTNNWRVSLGALNQSASSWPEALAIVSRASRWKIADASDIDAGERYYVEFSYTLDSSQLPRPMQLDLAAQTDWRLAVERTVRID